MHGIFMCSGVRVSRCVQQAVFLTPGVITSAGNMEMLPKSSAGTSLAELVAVIASQVPYP